MEVEVRPNPQGRLEEPFRLTVWLPLSLFPRLPPLGRGVYLRGEYRPGSRRLVAREVGEAPLWDDGEGQAPPRP